jgi:hypothetical protein
MFGCGVSDCVVSQHAMQHGWDASGLLQCPPLLQSATSTGFLVGDFLLWRCEQCLGVVFPTAWCHSTLCSMAGTRLVCCNVLRCCKAQQPLVFFGDFLLWRCEQCLGVVFPTAWCHSTLCSMAGTRLVCCNVLRCCKAQQAPVFFGDFLLWRCEQCLGVVFPTAWCHSTLCSMAGTRLVRCNVLRCCKAQQAPVFLLGIFCFGGVSNVWVWCFRLSGVTARYAAWLGRVWSAAMCSAVAKRNNHWFSLGIFCFGGVSNVWVWCFRLRGVTARYAAWLGRVWSAAMSSAVAKRNKHRFSLGIFCFGGVSNVWVWCFRLRGVTARYAAWLGRVWSAAMSSAVAKRNKHRFSCWGFFALAV